MNPREETEELSGDRVVEAQNNKEIEYREQDEQSASEVLEIEVANHVETDDER